MSAPASFREDQPSPLSSPPTPVALGTLFVGVALSGIGGGLPAHARRTLLARGWLTEGTFAEMFTLAQLMPGPNAVNLAAVVGARMCGGVGATASVLGILLPGLLAMLAASAATLGRPGGLPPVLQSGLKGAACAALGVLLTAALPVVRVGWGIRGGPTVTVLTLVALGVLRLDLLPVLLVLVGAGLLLHRPRRTA
ncbi:chromate transporter [Deinococcus hopiensis]|uniref:Chromate transporter n=1 Tax=Deinococcus hopiensis KR-140 TaxID=695939 RepID=A0A1W1VFB8_9DEIO|nr:chromate transporter [Deinococcus hopiensis]SMB91913.1 chromate transporter [Deinococcus hopiensis KR-140]